MAELSNNKETTTKVTDAVTADAKTEKKKERSGFWTRAISGLILCLVLIGFIIWGGYPLLGFMLIISELGMFEFYRVFKIQKCPMGILGYIAAIVYYADLQFQFIPVFPMLILGFMLFLMFFFVFSYPKYDAAQLMAAVFAFLYVTMMLSCIYRLRIMDPESGAGLYLAFIPFVCAWGSDTSAYLVGRKLGKHKMSPLLSPKKSVEGAIGGIVGAVLYTWLYCFLLRNKLNFDSAHILVMCGIGAVGAFCSMIGDLFASAIKRIYKVKDYGKLIPGHGGILDRFDSIIITAPIVYYLAYFLYQ